MAKTKTDQQSEQSIRILIRTIVREEIEWFLSDIKASKKLLAEQKEDRIAAKSQAYRQRITRARQETGEPLSLKQVYKRYGL